MTRTAAQILLFLLVGAVINVAIAWACVAWAPLNSGGEWPAGWPEDRKWPVPVPEDWPDPLQLCDKLVSSGFGMRYLDTWCEQSSGDPGFSTFCQQIWLASRIDAGWPFAALSAHKVSYLSDDRNWLDPRLYAFHHWDHGWQSKAIRDAPYHTNWQMPLPYGVLWPGFLLNTTLWGGLMMAVYIGLPITRQAVRLRRHLCPHCAYPVGISPVCTECGRPLPAAGWRKSVAQGVNPG